MNKEEINNNLNELLENHIDNPAIRAFVMVEIGEILDLAYQQGKDDKAKEVEEMIESKYSKKEKTIKKITSEKWSDGFETGAIDGYNQALDDLKQELNREQDTK